MCDSLAEGGRRCPAGALGHLKSATAALNGARAEEADLRALITNGNLEQMRVDDLNQELTDCTKRIIEKEAEVENWQRQYNTSSEQMARLKTVAENPTRSVEDRNEAASELAQAEQDVAKQKEQRNNLYKKQTALRNELTRQGIPADRIAVICDVAKKDTGEPYLRSYNYYKGALDKHRSARRRVRAEHEERLARIYKRGLPADEEKREVTQETENFKTADATILKKLQDSRLAYDSTVYTDGGKVHGGMKEMIDDTEAKCNQYIDDYNKASDPAEKRKILTLASEFHGKRKERIQRAKRVRNKRLSVRHRRELLFKLIKDETKAVGGDSDAALKAYRKPPVNVGRYSPCAPEDRKVSLRTHLADEDMPKIQKVFMASPEFKKYGHEGWDRYANRKLLVEPAALNRGKSDADLDEEAKRFDQGKKGRHKTVESGRREISHPTIVQEKNIAILRMRSKSLHMSMSSYCREMLLEGNPMKFQNDRSSASWQRKRNEIRNQLAEHGQKKAA